jgi:hypothetical protein
VRDAPLGTNISDAIVHSPRAASLDTKCLLRAQGDADAMSTGA